MTQQNQSDEKQIKLEKDWSAYPKNMEDLIQIYAKSWQMTIKTDIEPLKAMFELWTKPWDLKVLDKNNPPLKMLPEKSDESSAIPFGFTNFWWNPWNLLGEPIRAYSEMFQRFTESWMDLWKQKSKY